MRVIVTRPAAQAAAWVDGLRAHGIDAVAVPLIGIAPVADTVPLRAAWATLASRRLVVFVSPNAVEHFFCARPVEAGAVAVQPVDAGSVGALLPAHATTDPLRPDVPDLDARPVDALHSDALPIAERASGLAPVDIRPLPWPPTTLAGSPGPGTTHTLERRGLQLAQIVAPAADAPQFDSESLWAALQTHDWRGANVLVVRGGNGRDWLAETLQAHGARVEKVAAYCRVAPVWTAGERAALRAALDRPEEHVWLFSSSEAVDRLEAAAPAPAAWDRSRAIASHPRIAERARRLGFGRVVAAAPLQSAVVACIQSLGP